MTYMFRNSELNNANILSNALLALGQSFQAAQSSINYIASEGFKDLIKTIRYVIPCIGNDLQIHDKKACLSETSESEPFLLPICKQLTII